MRIAFLTPEFVTEKKFDGGLANYLQRTTIALKQAGHEPEVFVATDREGELEYRGIPVHRSRTFSPLDWRVMTIGRRLFGTKWIASWEALCVARALSRRLIIRHRETPFDVVQAADFQATGLRMPRRRVFALVTRLSYYAPVWGKESGRRQTLDSRLKEMLEIRAMRRSDSLYAPSALMANVVCKELATPVDVVHPAAFNEIAPSDEDVSIYDKTLRDKRYVLFFGRLCSIKGLDTLASAMATVLRNNESLWLTLVGREDPLGIVAELRRVLGESVSNRTLHLERLPHAQLYPIIRHAECVCLPSRIDNFPNTCIEAMALGRIVIGTRGTGFEDMLKDGENGFLVERDNAGELAAVIQQVLDLGKDARVCIEDAASRRIADFSPHKMIPSLVAYYRRCIQLHGVGRGRG